MYIRNDEFLKSLGFRIKQIRKEKGFTQEHLANEADIEISQISRLERGLLNTSISNLHQIANTLKIPLKELFDFDV